MLGYTISLKYMLTGYTVVLLVLAAYTTSLFIRWRNLKRDLHVLDEVQAKG